MNKKQTFSTKGIYLPNDSKHPLQTFDNRVIFTNAYVTKPRTHPLQAKEDPWRTGVQFGVGG